MYRNIVCQPLVCDILLSVLSFVDRCISTLPASLYAVCITWIYYGTCREVKDARDHRQEQMSYKASRVYLLSAWYTKINIPTTLLH